MMRKKNLTGQRFGRLTAVKEAPPHVYPNGVKRICWECVCECGNTVTVMGNDLISGHTKSCGCYNNDKRSERKLIDLTGCRFGMLTVIKRVGTKRKTSTTCSPLWLCKCDCGNSKVVQSEYLREGYTSSCGCLVSKGEASVEHELISADIPYAKQYTFPDLVSPKGFPYRFDFAVFDTDNRLMCLIEYQGGQHVPGNEFGKFCWMISDPAKKQYCKAHHIPLEEIWVNDDIHKRVTEIISRYSHADPVPSLSEEGATTIQ